MKFITLMYSSRLMFYLSLAQIPVCKFHRLDEMDASVVKIIDLENCFRTRRNVVSISRHIVS